MKGGPKIISTKGKYMNPDSVSKPVTRIAGVPTIITAKPPTVTPLNFNVRPACEPQVVTAGIPHVNMPGTSGLSLPRIKPANGKRILCGIPKIVVAKDAGTKDVNPGNFSFYKTLQGLNRNVILCMLQDKKGNLWLGTGGGGLSRFDGKFFTNFTEKEGLPNISITSMIEDKNGNFWLGTDEGGAVRYDGKFFTHFDTTYLRGKIHSILEDQTGKVWFGTDHGVSCYDELHQDGGKARFINYTINEGLTGNEVYSIIEDKTGKIWFGTNGGVSCFKDSTRNYFMNFTTHEGLASNKVKSIFEDHKGNIWFGMDGGGVTRFDGNRIDEIEKGRKISLQDLNNLKKENGKLVKTFTNFTENEGLSSNKISCLLEDNAGNIWFGTDTRGLCCYHYSKEGKGFFVNYTEQEGLPDNRIICLLKDNTNNLLFGTSGGVCIYYGKYFTNFTEKEGFTNSNVYCMLEDKAGKLWFGTYGNGICIFDGKTFSSFTTKEGLIDDKVYSILEDRHGKIWIGTGNGVSCYEQYPKDGGPARFINYTKKEGLVYNHVLDIGEDKKGGIWFCTANGISCYKEPLRDGDNACFTNFTEKEGLAGNVVVSILEDGNGNLWFGTYGAGMSCYNGKSFTNFTQKEGLPSNNIYSMLEDKAGNIWFGTYGNGVLYYNGKSFLNFTAKDGLAADIVLNLLQDKRGNIWLGTSRGLSRINHYNWKQLYGNSNKIPEALFYNYDYNDGFIGLTCMRNSVLQDRNERIWWGTERLTCYLPQGDEINTTAPNIELTGVKLFGQEIPWSGVEASNAGSLKQKPTTELLSDTLGNGIALHHINFDSTSRWYNVPQNLKLPYDNNSISFSFIGIHMQSRNHIKYQYQLHGLENYWSYTQNTEVSFSNLLPGDYSFIVKAMNQSGNWSKPIAYKFTILPPWFRTTPAYVLYLLLAAVLIYLIIINFKARSLMIEKKKLKILVDERTSEVVMQKNKAEKLLKVKENFLSNMSHEIRTPLTAIIGYTDLSLKETSLLKVYKYLHSIKVSSDHLHNLVNNILDIAKMESGSLRFHKINFDLKETLEEVKHLMQFLALRRGNTLNIQIPKTSSTWVFGDKEKLLQVLLNLIDNAIKFTENGQIDVHVELQEKLHHQVDAFFTIKDTGIGVSENKLHTIFESFTQADNTITRTYGGTGLGLTICKKIIELQGGEINVKSVEKEGSEFSFRIPYLPGKKQETLPETFQVGIPDLRGFRVLVAEDDSVNEELLRTILSQWELSVDFAGNGEKLIALLQKNTYHLILMDIHMPGMSGVEVAAKIRKEMDGPVKDIPIIALTADVLSSTKEKIIGSGITNVLYKPINTETLYRNIIAELGLKAGPSLPKDLPESWEIKTENINLNYLIESCGQNKNQLLKILSGSFEKLIEYNSALAVAYREQDFDQLYFIAHKLGSILKILGILELDPRLTKLKEGIHSSLTAAESEMQDTIMYVDTVIKKSAKEIDTVIAFISKN